jgi:hypothetical protein
LHSSNGIEGVLKIFFSKFCCVKFSLTFAIPKKGVVLYCALVRNSDYIKCHSSLSGRIIQCIEGR